MVFICGVKMHFFVRKKIIMLRVLNGNFISRRSAGRLFFHTDEVKIFHCYVIVIFIDFCAFFLLSFGVLF